MVEYKIKPWQHQKDAIEKAKALPNFALFFEVGCLARDAEIKISMNGCMRIYTIEELYRLYNGVELAWNQKGFTKKHQLRIRSLKGDRFGLHKFTAIVRSGEKDVYELRLLRGKRLKLTADHQVYTKRGWVQAKDLDTTDLIAVDITTRHQKKVKKKIPRKLIYRYRAVGEYHPFRNSNRRVEAHRLVMEARLNKISVRELIDKTYSKNDLKFLNPKEFHVHHIDRNPHNNGVRNLLILTPQEHKKLHAEEDSMGSHFGHGDIFWSRFKSFTYVGKEMTYDIVCEDPYRNFTANNIVVHNCGKSATAINILRHKFDGCLKKTLIFCPPIVVDNWKREWLMHSEMSEHSILLLKGSGKRRVNLFEQYGFNRETGEGLPKIVVTNYEALLMQDLYNLIGRWAPEYYVFDESHKFKSVTSRRFKLLNTLVNKAKPRPEVLLLTGSPVLNSPMDLYTQFKVMDNGLTFGDNFYHFRKHFFADRNAGMPKNVHFPKWEIKTLEKDGKDAIEEINKKISPVSARVTKAEALDLPPLVRKTIEVEMTANQLRVYESMKKDFVAFMDADHTGEPQAVVANLAITKALRLMQIVSGFAKTDKGREINFPGSPKIHALSELLEELTPDHKVIVWAVWRQNYDEIRKVCQKLGVKYVEVHGEISAAAKADAVDTFNNSPDCRVFIGHPGSGGVGINLISSDISIFYSRNFSLEYDIQAEGRNHRGGSEIHKKITRYDIVCQDTIDDLVRISLANKTRIGEDILKSISKMI